MSPTEISWMIGRRDRIVRRASFAATATSQPRICVGSFTSPIRRQAIAQAA
jgi:hypothetical protein